MNSVIRERLFAIENRFGHLTPHAVLEDALDAQSPLNKCFEWDDSSAAAQFRLLTAAKLIRDVRVVVRTSDDVRNTVRQFALIHGDDVDSPRGRYVRIERALQDVDLRRELIDRARRELRDYERKYYLLLQMSETLRAGVGLALQSLDAV